MIFNLVSSAIKHLYSQGDMNFVPRTVQIINAAIIAVKKELRRPCKKQFYHLLV